MYFSNTFQSGYTLFFYKKLESGLSSQSCLYFQGFQGSKLGLYMINRMNKLYLLHEKPYEVQWKKNESNLLQVW